MFIQNNIHGQEQLATGSLATDNIAGLIKKPCVGLPVYKIKFLYPFFNNIVCVLGLQPKKGEN